MRLLQLYFCNNEWEDSYYSISPTPGPWRELWGQCQLGSEEEREERRWEKRTGSIMACHVVSRCDDVGDG